MRIQLLVKDPASRRPRPGNMRARTACSHNLNNASLRRSACQGNHNEAELPPLAASDLLSQLRVNMPVSASAFAHATPSIRHERSGSTTYSWFGLVRG